VRRRVRIITSPGAARAHVVRDGVPHLVLAAGRRTHEPCNGRGFLAEELIERGEGRRESKCYHGRSGVQAGRRFDRLVRRLIRLHRALDEVREDPVHEAKDRGTGTEALRELEYGPPGLLRGLLRLPAEEGNLGAPKAVDGLLRVSDDHEAAGLVPGEQVGDLDLQPIRILELVDDQEAEPPAEVAAYGFAVAERVAGDEEKIDEVEQALLALPPVVDVDHCAERRHEPAVQPGSACRAPRLGARPRPFRDLAGPR
jgi:hypothetical protein